MASKKTIAFETKRSFSRYFDDNEKPSLGDFRLKLLNQTQSDTDDNERKINNENSTSYYLFHRQKKDENIIGNSAENSNAVEESAAVQEPVISTDKIQNWLCPDYAADGTIENLIRDLTSPENCIDIIQQDVPCGDIQQLCSTATVVENSVLKKDENCTAIEPNEEKFDFLNDELSNYIQLFDRQEKGLPCPKDKEIELLVAKQESPPIIEPADNSSLEDLIYVASDNVPVDLSLVGGFPQIIDPMYEVIQDPADQTRYVIRQKALIKISIRNKWTGVVTEYSSISFNNEEFPPCYIKINDCLKKRPKLNPFEGKKFYMNGPGTRYVDSRVKKPKRLNPQQNAANHKKKQRVAPKRKVEREIVKPPPTLIPFQANAKINSEIVVEPPARLNPIPKSRVQITEHTLPLINLTEEKFPSIQEWLSSQVQPDNVGAMKKFQYDNLPILTDCEAFALANFIEQPANKERNIDSVNDEISSNAKDEPIDSTIKQFTPISNDTGFCNDSISLEVESPGRSGTNQEQTIHSNIVGDVHASVGRQVDEPITEVSPETKRPMMQQSIFQIDEWNINSPATELDYEPSEDDDDDESTEDEPIKDESIKDEPTNDDIKLPETAQEKINAIQPKQTALGPTRMIIRVPNASGGSPIVIKTTAVDVVRSKPLKALKSAPVNIVESLPQSVSTQDNKRATLPSSVPITTHQIFSSDMLEPASDTSYELIRKQLDYVLDRPCYSYRNRRHCIGGIWCEFNHELPPTDYVYDKLMQFSNDTIMGMYTNFFEKNEDALVAYFPTMCKIFGERKMESSLLVAIMHCDRRKKTIFYKNIYDALVMIGFSKFAALSKIADRSCKNMEAINVIFGIIIETDPECFIDMLRKCYKYVNIQTNDMLTLSYRMNEMPTPSPALLTLFVDIFDKYSMSISGDVGQYKMICLSMKALVKGDKKLSRRLNEIGRRDNRV